MSGLPMIMSDKIVISSLGNHYRLFTHDFAGEFKSMPFK